MVCVPPNSILSLADRFLQKLVAVIGLRVILVNILFCVYFFIKKNKCLERPVERRREETINCITLHLESGLSRFLIVLINKYNLSSFSVFIEVILVENRLG